MKFKEFVKRTDHYLREILDIGVKEFPQRTFKIWIHMGKRDSSNSGIVLGETYLQDDLIIIYYRSFSRAIAGYMKRYRSGVFKKATKKLSMETILCPNETQAMKNLMIETLIHELFHLNQYMPPLSHIDHILNNKYHCNIKYLKVLERPVQYKTVCFLIDHREELYNRFGYVPMVDKNTYLPYSIYLMIRECAKEKNFNLPESALKQNAKEGVKEFFMDQTEGKRFVPYKKASNEYQVSVQNAYEHIEMLQKEYPSMSKDELAEAYLTHYYACRKYAQKVRNGEDDK